MTLQHKLARYAVTGAIALAAFAQPFMNATAAHAAPNSPSYFDRNRVIQRAMTWVNAGVPYSQTAWLGDYRTDCSGFVSMAWGLDKSYVTWSLPEVAVPINKDDLQPGDILLNYWKHVVIFDGWANPQHTSYVVLEQAGKPHQAVKRVISYPYDWGSISLYKPYRYVGGHNVFDKNNALSAPLVETYAGSGQVIAPSFAAGVNAQRMRQADVNSRARLDRIHAQERAAKAAAKKRLDAIHAQERAAKAAAKHRLDVIHAQERAAKAAADKAAADKASAEASAAKAAAAQREAAAAKAKAAQETASEPLIVKILQVMLSFISR